MDTTLVIHVVAGALGLGTGYVALYAAKGGRLHRKSGMLFVYVMLTMCTAGAAMALLRDKAPAINVPAAVLTAYLVITSLVTVRRRTTGTSWLDAAGMLVALALAVACLILGAEAVGNGGARKGIPAFPFFLFGIVSLLAAAGDVRMIRTGPLTGARRIARHLWRMSFALLIAALSFFLGQAKVIPKPIRIPALLALPILAVLVTMLYWLWRVRGKRSMRGLIGVGASEAA